MMEMDMNNNVLQPFEKLEKEKKKNLAIITIFVGTVLQISLLGGIMWTVYTMKDKIEDMNKTLDFVAKFHGV